MKMTGKAIIQAIQSEHDLQTRLVKALIQSNQRMAIVGKSMAESGTSKAEQSLGRDFLMQVEENNEVIAEFDQHHFPET